MPLCMQGPQDAFWFKKKNGILCLHKVTGYSRMKKTTMRRIKLQGKVTKHQQRLVLTGVGQTVAGISVIKWEVDTGSHREETDLPPLGLREQPEHPEKRAPGCVLMRSDGLHCTPPGRVPAKMPNPTHPCTLALTDKWHTVNRTRWWSQGIQLTSPERETPHRTVQYI